MSKAFKFKQFTIHQDRCAMKVGTDGVLLGAWASLDHQPKSILDIGAGTGLLSLMLAQRAIAETIDALEIDEESYEQCVENFEASVWADRLFCYHAGLKEFVVEMDDKYDLIVSNPPFYSEENKGEDPSRDRARQNLFLPFEELLAGVASLLSATGIFSVIIPFREEAVFLKLAVKYSLFPGKITRVKGNKEALVKRSLIALQFSKKKVIHQQLTIETARHQYTEDYMALTREFYLKM